MADEILTEEEDYTKPRKKVRNNQYQSARLYLRRKDHRDVIYQDSYVNSICLEQDDKFDAYWTKYKPKVLLGNTYVGSPALGYMTSVDAKNRIVHRSSSYGTAYMKFIPLKDYIVCFPNENSSGGQTEMINVSKNGHVWYTIKYPSKVKGWVRYGDTNSLAWASYSGSTMYVYAVDIEEDEEGNYTVSEPRTLATQTISNIWSCYTLSRTNEGVLVACGSYFDANLYEITDSGITAVYNYTNNDFPRMRYACYGNGRAVLPVVIYDGSVRYHYYNQLRVCVVSHGVANEVLVDMEDRYSYVYNYTVADVIHKNGKWWLYWMLYWSDYSTGSRRDLWELRLYTSSDAQTWEKVELPDYVDVPICETSFMYDRDGADNPYTTLRVGLTTSKSIPSGDGITVRSVYLHSMGGNTSLLGLNFGTSLIDGKSSDVEQGIVIDCNGWYAYFENMDLSDHENNFGWCAYYQREYAEPLQEGDYCYK